jgi:hypothetical protein
MVIEKYIIEVYKGLGVKGDFIWEERYGQYDDYQEAYQTAMGLIERGETCRICAQRFEYADTELVDTFEPERKEDDPGTSTGSAENSG